MVFPDPFRFSMAGFASFGWIQGDTGFAAGATKNGDIN
jgi:hypothetical protein